MNGSRTETQAWLHRAFPLVAAMGLEIVTLEPGHVVTRVPLERNHNVHGTAFAGSLATQAMLTGWLLLTRDLEAAGIRSRMLQREATIRYIAPINSDPLCRCVIPLEQLEGFRNALTAHGKARLDTEIDLFDGESLAAVLNAGYSARMRL